MENTWISRLIIECPLKEVIPQFLEHLEPMDIRPDEIYGRVLVVGQASAFPERSLICTSQSRYKLLRPEITGLYCCDPHYPSSPEFKLNIPCINTIGYEHIPNPSINTAYYELSTTDEFLPRTPVNFFNTVLMFRAKDTGRQIQNQGLVPLVAKHLAIGGHFICSGGFFPETISEDLFKPLNMVRFARLSDWSEGYIFYDNYGVVLTKQ